MRSLVSVWTLPRIAKALLLIGLFASLPSIAQANAKYAGIVVDAKTGKTLYAASADEPRYPASLTKIMTLYVVFEELEARRLSLDTPLKVSAYAAGQPPSKIGLKPGSTISVKDAILALITKSANDVAVVVAENIGGSEARFAERMTRTARQIGMTRTTFRNPHGLPNSGQRTTARDMAQLGRAIQERFPSYYGYFKTRSFAYRGRTYGNHNKLLGHVAGVDGIKTGFIRASGFNLVTSVNRDGRHVVAVVMGGQTGRSRDAQMVKLINEHLPKASRGPRTAPALVARPAAPGSGQASRPTGGGFVAASLGKAPLPPVKPQLVAGTPEPATGDPVVLTTGSISMPRVAAAFEVFEVPVPVAAPQPAVAAPVPTSSPLAPSAVADADAAADEPTTVTVATNNTADRASGWQVQIAAAESELEAIRLLKKARAATGSALRSREPYTEPVQTNGQTLYRARFVGFGDKTAAMNACKSLKRAKFACYAVYQ
ncbi:D-alanyl-D-alanine carboxypeptidase [Polymorphum gilvum]|uniref:D-alanyl-D-alanine carboxypeptidase family n=1 Tax=Polymorphum gilvum (strain LMG 25793 / CGMCC 1.9160 / SL003B-26A1) TaxID=991905 RepID=F2IVW8_POLGS|nr:D-alanyl-D-alanine carboxypeptidase [Polymorphum gilvum]ADZ70250.1 D-alanyl-D-alanine carboxypeptidase family [Polymorphum gilvum SL003B-26A1]